MPRIRSFSNTAMYVYAAPGEHPPPHFHIVGPEVDVAVEIETLRIMAGRYRPKDVAEAMSWAADNIRLLHEKWELYNARD